MALSEKTRKILWGRSGNRCALCRRELVIDSTPLSDDSVVGDECHIVSGKGLGPRHDPALLEEPLDLPENLVLLDSALADRLSLPAMETEIFARAPDGGRKRARQQLSRETAGLVPPPADLSRTPVVERSTRLMSTTGDLFEKKLADRLGAQRARILRSQEDGWRNKTITNGCD